MAGELNLFVDVINRKLVKSELNAAEFIPPYFVQGETVTLNIYFLNPTPSTPSAPFEFLTFSGATVKVGLCGGTGLPTGTTGDPTPTVIAYQDSFSTITTPNGFTGDLSLNNAAVATFLGTDDDKNSMLEIELTPSGGTPKKYVQKLVSVRAEVIESASLVPDPSADYPTRAEVTAGWVKKVGAAGDTITLVSPNGSYARILGVNNDGTAMDDIVAL